MDQQQINMMNLSTIAVLLIAVLHVYILILEMFLWDKPRGMKSFGLTPEFAKASAVLAANQGLYNGFLAAGLVWGLLQGSAGFGVKIFFLCCVIVAGVYGGLTSNRRIIMIQAVPAAVALLLVLAANSQRQ